jgi:hypothetical protein
MAVLALIAGAVLAAGAVYRASGEKGTKCRTPEQGCAKHSGATKRRPKRGIYVAEQQRGAGNGSSCANAYGVTWFNNPTDWGSGPGRIHANTTVRLCGTISTPLTVHGSGAPARPITIAWETGATLSAPAWTGRGAIDTNGFGNLTFNGGGTGSIQATAEGTGLAMQGVPSRGVYALNCNGCVFENLTIENLYVHTSPSDVSVDQTLDNAILFSGSHITIADNTIHDVGWALFSQWTNGNGHDRIYGNNIYRFDHGFAATASGTVGPMFFYRNHLHDMANWDAAVGGDVPYHHDGLHCFGPVGGPAPTYTGFYIYDNRFDGTVGRAAPTAQIFMEGGTGPGRTPCASSSSAVYLFNNVITSSDFDTANQYMNTASIAGGVYNNTVIGASKTDSLGGCGGYAYEQPGSEVAFANNVLSTCDNLMNQAGEPNGSFRAGSPDYNVYANGGENSFTCDGNFYGFSQFSAWKACVNGDRHSRRVATAELDNVGAPEPGSRVLDAGVNLTPLCKGLLAPLCTDITGRRRPRTGPWNAGAY